jgi:ubiquinone biosynthesis protein
MRQRTGLDRFRESLRLQQVYNTFARYGFDMLLDQGVIGDWRRRVQEFIYQPGVPVLPLSRPIKTRLMIQELGPTYVKMGQIISSRSQVLPPEWAEELNKLQSNVPSFPSEQVRTILIEELGAPPEQLYDSFEPVPFAAASTAQVHHAWLTDGTHAVVKVQRPDILKQVKADINVMDRATTVMERQSQYVRDISLVGMINEFGDGIIRELDYGGELYNMKRLARNMEPIAGVMIPTAYTALCSTRVLTMDFVEGVKISNVAAMDGAGLDRYAIGVTVLRALIKQLLIDGFFHADPHPGNVLVNLDTGVVTFIDMGMMGELDPMKRLNLVNLLMVVRQQDPAGLARAVRSLSVSFRENTDDEAFYRDFERSIARYMDPEVPTGFGSLMGVVFDLLSTHGLRLDADLTLAIKAMVQAEAIYNVLHPAGGGLTEAGFDITMELLREEATAENIFALLRKQSSNLLQEVVKELPSLQDATMGWLKQYQRGRFELHLDTSDLSKEVYSLQAIARQIIIGIMLVGMIIGSSIAASLTTVTGNEVSELAQWALWGYFGSMIIAVIFVLVLIYRLLFGGSRSHR